MQNVQIKGTLSGCSGEESSEVTGGSFQIHGKTEAIACAALKSGAATDQGPIKLKWKPTPAAGSQSQGTVSVQLIEGAGFLTGLITSGPFGDDDLIGGERVLTQVYTGGPECGKETEHKGKKAKKVNKGTVSGTLSISFRVLPPKRGKRREGPKALARGLLCVRSREPRGAGHPDEYGWQAGQRLLLANGGQRGQNHDFEAAARLAPGMKKPRLSGAFRKRRTGLEPATSSLGSLRSTN